MMEGPELPPISETPPTNRNKLPLREVRQHAVMRKFNAKNFKILLTFQKKSKKKFKLGNPNRLGTGLEAVAIS